MFLAFHEFKLRKIVSLLGDILLIFIDSIPASQRHTHTTSLVIIRVDNIGDFVLWLPSAKHILENYQNYRPAVLICNQACVDFAKATGLFSQVIGIDLRRFVRDLGYRLRLIRQVAQLGAEIAIQPTYSRVFLTGDSLIRASHAKQRIGLQGDFSNIRPWQKAISDRWYTQLVPASPTDMMELDRNAEFLRGLGMRDAQAEIPSIPKLMDLAPEKQVGKNYFVLFPGASSPIKQWPVDSFAAVANHVVDQFGWLPVVCGGPVERLLGDQLIEKLNLPSAINFSGSTTLPELTELLRGARLVISNDTSAIHIATGVGVPSVCILGGGHYGRFMPYPNHVDGVKPISVIHKMDCFGCNWQCKLTKEQDHAYPCVQDISVKQVLKAVKIALMIAQKKRQSLPH
jgi:ADP-heptose:LPS heptosyltransferase